MTHTELQNSLIQRACLGNQEALDFLQKFRGYVHAIDDCIDEKVTIDFRVTSYIKALDCYTSIFFLKNLPALKQTIVTITNLYADSETIKDIPNFPEFARHFGAEMILTVAYLCGGYEHVRAISHEVRMLNWSKHHGEYVP